MLVAVASRARWAPARRNKPLLAGSPARDGSPCSQQPCQAHSWGGVLGPRPASTSGFQGHHTPAVARGQRARNSLPSENGLQERDLIAGERRSRYGSI